MTHPTPPPLPDTLDALRTEYEGLDRLVEDIMWHMDVISARIAVEELLEDVRNMVEGG
jgi:hypothetical protein